MATQERVDKLVKFMNETKEELDNIATPKFVCRACGSTNLVNRGFYLVCNVCHVSTSRIEAEYKWEAKHGD